MLDGQLVSPGHGGGQPVGVEVLEGAAAQGREADAEDGAEVGVGDRAEDAFFEAANKEKIRKHAKLAKASARLAVAAGGAVRVDGWGDQAEEVRVAAYGRRSRRLCPGLRATAFESPNTLDTGRSNKAHLAFGRGRRVRGSSTSAGPST